jgi:DNA replication and repair protein RecF
LLTFNPTDGINVIYGLNGSGKTSLLDGIHYCALTRGFVSAADSEYLSFLSDFFLLESNFVTEVESSISVKITYTKEREKQIIVNNCDIKSYSTHIGRIPCITFSPPEIIIVNGAPSERRRFIDSAICQINKRYLDDLIAYRRVLHQRNALLLQLRDNRSPHPEMLSLWTENISRLAASIVHTRVLFIVAFLVRFRELYRQLSINEYPSINYRSSIGKIRSDTSREALYALFLLKYKETESQEIFRGQTLTGPHRDDLVFFINEKEIKKYASQGQLRTFLIGLKLSQHRFYYDTLGEKPLCLLDDIFSELDASRIAEIFNILETCGQTIITSAEQKGQGNVNIISLESLKKLGAI